ncbi:MAG: DNA-processing protein DprA [bacterium]|nr:DNA-processing protein DprA [bacterium]
MKAAHEEIRILAQKDFPGLLQGLLHVSEPPQKLHVRGALPEEGAALLTVVGSRKHSRYGEEATRTLISGLRGYPISIVSGLAFGIDSLAHRAALDAGLPAIAIPGSGISDEALYPREHLSLAREIMEKGGALLSEFAPDFRATTWSFIKRNRIMAGISKAVLIVEAEERSGTLVTARFALEYGKDILAVPGSVFSETSRGTNWLIREGATPVSESADVLRALGFEPEAEKERGLGDASEAEALLYGMLREPKTREELRIESGLSASAQNAALSMLEIKGFIKEEGGKLRRC